MAEMIGVLNGVTHAGANNQFHAMIVNIDGDERRFGTGRDNPEGKVGIGSLIKFDANKNDKGYWQAELNTVVLVDKAPDTGGTAMPTPSRPPAPGIKDLVIQLQSCRNSAIDTVRLLLSEGALKLPTALNKKYDVINAEVDAQVERYWNQNASIRTSSGPYSANGIVDDSPTSVEASAATPTEKDPWS